MSLNVDLHSSAPMAYAGPRGSHSFCKNQNNCSLYCGMCVLPTRLLLAAAYLAGALKFMTGVTTDKTLVTVAIVAVVVDSMCAIIRHFLYFFCNRFIYRSREQLQQFASSTWTRGCIPSYIQIFMWSHELSEFSYQFAITRWVPCLRLEEKTKFL